MTPAPDESHFTRLFCSDLPAVREILLANGWVETVGDEWDLRWEVRMRDAAPLAGAGPGHVVARLPGLGGFGEKWSLHETLGAARRRAARRGADADHAFFPPTWSMPEDRDAFLAAAAADPEAMWIRKPRSPSAGERSALVSDPLEVDRHPLWIVQRYLNDPHLVDGCKYTLRFYLLISGLDPLLAWAWEDGLVNVASRPFTTRREQWADRFVHFTTAGVPLEETSVDAPVRGMTHGRFRERLRAEGIDDESLWAKIHHVLGSTAIAAREPLLQQARRSGWREGGAFELLGVDILVDAKLEPWLLACNIHPSLDVRSAPGSQQHRDELDRDVVEGVLTLIGALDADAWATETDEEDRTRRALAQIARRGRFHPLFPVHPDEGAYEELSWSRRSDRELALSLFNASLRERRVVPGAVQEHLLGAGAVLYGEENGEICVMSPAAAFTWVGVTEGSEIDSITDAVTAKLGNVEPETVREMVEDLVASWADKELLVPNGTLRTSPGQPVTRDPDRRLASWMGALVGEGSKAVFVAVSADAAPGFVAALQARDVAAREERAVLRCDREGVVHFTVGTASRIIDPSRVMLVAAGWPDVVGLDSSAALAAALGGGLQVAPLLTAGEVEPLLAWFGRGRVRCIFADSAESLERLVAAMARDRGGASGV